MSEGLPAANREVQPKLRLRELRNAHARGLERPAGPLLNLILGATRRPAPRGESSGANARVTGQRNAKRAFLVELELSGEPRLAAERAGCSLLDVRHWRATDQMFSRDFALAVLHNVKGMEVDVRAVADGPEEFAATRARALLQSKGCYIGSDGRLNLRAWRDALLAFAREDVVRPVVDRTPA